MGKGLKALKIIRWKLEDEGILGKEYELCDAIQEELKALEIILTKDIDIGVFKKLAFGRVPLTNKEKLDYWNDIHNSKITMEEFDLLKEVLLWNI